MDPNLDQKLGSGFALSPRAVASVLVAAAVAGAVLRFAGLSGREMSTDEAPSWTAASAATAAGVVRLQAVLNPGKLAVHELALHGWIALFGQGLFALRALSALLGTLSIGLVFMVARELFAPPPEGADGQAAAETQAVAALSAFVFAVNLVTIKYSREARMYPLMLFAALLQMAFFLRASRLGGLLNSAGVAIFTALALATNFSAALILAPEGLWILWLVWRDRGKAANLGRRLELGLGLAVGVALLLPFRAAFRSNAAALQGGILYWVRRPPLWEPLAFFNKATGSFAFPVMIALAGWGVVRGWRRVPGALAFALLWMWVPVMLLMVVSLAYKPVFVERYALSSFVPFFVLVALGIRELPSSRARLGTLVLVAALSLGHIAAYYRKAHDVQWREAATLAARELRAGEPLAVAPPYGPRVLRYYLGPAERDLVLPVADGAAARVLVMGDRDVSAGERAELAARYPHLLGRFRGVEVRER